MLPVTKNRVRGSEIVMYELMVPISRYYAATTPYTTHSLRAGTPPDMGMPKPLVMV